MGILTEVSHEYFHYTMPARIVTSARALKITALATGGGAGRQPEITRATKKGLT